ncbi:MAG: uracil-DNA glycosylase [Deltaproteobacteria bacterium]|nr:uracil-DNA glycosylase [Deltaproteobacteria bacterium]
MLKEIIDAAAGFLRYQGELGLRGLDVGDAWMSSRATSTAAAPGLPPGEALLQIRAELGECTRCKLAKHRTHIVFGVGNPEARLMFVGEGPGRDEDLQGEPFVGAAGQLLDRMIRAMGLERKDVYIANIVKCRPPKNRDPEPDEISTCQPFLIKQIQAVRPRVMVTLGRVAAQVLLQEGTPITRLRGQWREVLGIRVMPTYHPAYLLRNPQEKKPVWLDLKAVMLELGLSGSAR